MWFHFFRYQIHEWMGREPLLFRRSKPRAASGRWSGYSRLGARYRAGRASSTDGGQFLGEGPVIAGDWGTRNGHPLDKRIFRNLSKLDAAEADCGLMLDDRHLWLAIEPVAGSRLWRWTAHVAIRISIYPRRQLSQLGARRLAAVIERGSIMGSRRRNAPSFPMGR